MFRSKRLLVIVTFLNFVLVALVCVIHVRVVTKVEPSSLRREQLIDWKRLGIQLKSNGSSNQTLNSPGE